MKPARLVEAAAYKWPTLRPELILIKNNPDNSKNEMTIKTLKIILRARLDRGDQGPGIKINDILGYFFSTYSDYCEVHACMQNFCGYILVDG